jgi:AcrR family transcriptional regulator
VTEAVNTMGKTTKRAEQARATRRRIIGCARQLFLEQGYAATTLDQVAAAAGVAVQTVYFHFGNKRTVLKEVMDVAAVGDDEPVPLLDRSWLQAVRDEPDPWRALGIWLETSRAIFGRVAPLLSVVRDAAGADPEMAEQWRVNEEQRYIAHRSLAELLTAKGDVLRQGLTVDDAADIIFTLLSPEVYLLLTSVRGWPPARWQDWAAGTIARAILRLPMTAAHKRPVAALNGVIGSLDRTDTHIWLICAHKASGASTIPLRHSRRSDFLPEKWGRLRGDGQENMPAYRTVSKYPGRCISMRRGDVRYSARERAT